MQATLPVPAPRQESDRELTSSDPLPSQVMNRPILPLLNRRHALACLTPLWLGACGGGGGGGSPGNSGSASGSGAGTGGPTASTALAIQSVSTSTPSALSLLGVTLANAQAGTAVTGSLTINGATYQVAVTPSAKVPSMWLVPLPAYWVAAGANGTSAYQATVQLSQGAQQVSVPVSVSDLPALSTLGATVGQITVAMTSLLQLNLGQALNGLQVLRWSKGVQAQAGAGVLATLDTEIARHQAALASWAQLQQAARQVMAGSASVALGTATNGSTLSLDAVALEVCDRVLASHLLSVPGLASLVSQQAHAAGGQASEGLVAHGFSLTSLLNNATKYMTNLQQAASGNGDLLTVLGGAAAAVGIAAAVVAAAPAVLAAAGATATVVEGAAAVADGLALYSQITGTAVAGLNVMQGLGVAATSSYLALTSSDSSQAATYWNQAQQGAGQAVSGVMGVATGGLSFLKNPIIGTPLTAASNTLSDVLNGFSLGLNATNLLADTDTTVQAVQFGLGYVGPVAQVGVTATPSATGQAGGSTQPQVTLAQATPSSTGSGSSASPQPTVSTPLDATGQGILCLPDTLTPSSNNPINLAQTNPANKQLLGALQNILGSARILFATPACSYVGAYTGSYSGGDAGSANATISAANTLTAQATSSLYGRQISASGQVSPTGQFLAVSGSTSGGASFNGNLSSANGYWQLNGNWSNPGSGLSGTFAMNSGTC